MRKIAVRCLLLLLTLLAISAPSFAQFRVAITFAPPAIPIYEQPICPGDGYIWTPGYWAWDDDDGDYYWVPGTWVPAPEVGFLWTPGYWGWGGSSFVFYEGYWGPVVGFYGGINYGFGYFGHGFVGGRWDHDHFFYNREVSRIDVNVIHNVYSERETNITENRISFNGGRGGIEARPTPQEETAAHERHIGPVSAQVQHVQAARGNRELRASENHGKPAVAATARPGDFSGREVVKAKEAGAPYNPPNRGGTARDAGGNASRGTPVHPKELPPAERRVAPNTGNPQRDQKYQQQQERLATKQDQERQKLQQQQDREHQKLAQQKANDARTQQLEQKHQQQTQQLVQKHSQQREQLQSRQQPRQGADKPKPH